MSYWFDEAAADRVEEFGRKFVTHRKGEWAGQPLILAPWQRESIVRPLFGWRREDGTRKHRSASIWTPRKSGKSTLAVLLSLYLLFGDGEPGAEVYAAAADKEQARIVFGLAKSSVEDSPTLLKRAKVYRDSIVIPSTESVFRVLSSDAKTKHGFNSSALIYDEVHAWPDGELYDVLHTSTGSRRSPLEISISTAGIYDPEGFAYQLYDYAKKVRDANQLGQPIDDTLLPVIFEADTDADFRDEAQWHRANPGLGTSIKLDYLRAEAKRAEALPSAEAAFRQLHLGQWIQSVDSWLSLSDWDACRVDPFPDLTGRECFAGLDLATTTDVSALALIFPGEPTYCVLRAWIPEAKVKANKDKVPYDRWAKAGWLTVTPGATVDYDQIRADINALAQKYRITDIRYDRWNATQLVSQLDGDGFDLTEVGQGFASLSAPTKEMERLVVSHSLAHDSNPLLRYMVSNVAVTRDSAGNVKPDRKRSKGRIDGVLAIVDALSGVIGQQAESDFGYYLGDAA